MKNFINVMPDTEAKHERKIKSFWKKYGIASISVLFIIIASMYYQDYRSTIELKKSKEQRDSFISILSSNDTQVLNNYIATDPLYATQASLALAKTLVSNQDFLQALKVLAPLTKHYSPAIANAAQLRSARINHQIGKYSSALENLEIYKPSSFSSPHYHLAGDIYLSMGDLTSAIIYYNKALNTVTSPEIHTILTLKLNNLK